MEKYETLERELVETLKKSFTYKDLEALGKDIFGEGYDTHALERISVTVSISPANAAKRIVYECVQRNKLETLMLTLIQLDGNYLNDRIVKVFNVENLMYHQAQAGFVYNSKSRKFIAVHKEKALMANWGSLRDGKEYVLTVASIDIVGNSKLVTKYGSAKTETIYGRLLQYMRDVLQPYEGRVWSWQGDGGLLAFPKGQNLNLSVLCCMNILMSLPVFNLRPDNPLTQDIVLRIALDNGEIKFFNDTGRIVSETINYAAHLEKQHAKPGEIAISNEIYRELSPKMKRIFPNREKFENRYAHSTVFTVGSDAATKKSVK